MTPKPLCWLPLLALVACSSTQPVARNATATVAVAPVAAPPTAERPPAMPPPPPPPPAKKVLSASERIPLVDVVKAVTTRRRAVALGPRKESVFAELKKEGFTGFPETFPPNQHGTYSYVALADYIIVVDIDDDDVPVITDGGNEVVVVHWRHRRGKRLFLEPGYVDTRCHEAVCDAFTVYRVNGVTPKWDFGDLPLAEMMPWNGEPLARAASAEKRQ